MTPGSPIESWKPLRVKGPEYVVDFKAAAAFRAFCSCGWDALVPTELDAKAVVKAHAERHTRPFSGAVGPHRGTSDG